MALKTVRVFPRTMLAYERLVGSGTAEEAARRRAASPADNPCSGAGDTGAAVPIDIIGTSVSPG